MSANAPTASSPSLAVTSVTKKQKLLIQLLLSDSSFLQAIADCVPPSQQEKLSDSFVAIARPLDKATLAMIKALVELEFERKKLHPMTVLRVNSIATKVMGKYAST